MCNYHKHFCHVTV